MTNKFDEAINRNIEASEELDRALRDCLKAIRDKPEAVVEGRFRVVTGGRRGARRQARASGWGQGIAGGGGGLRRGFFLQKKDCVARCESVGPLCF